MVSRPPATWVEANAWDISSLWDSISKNHPSDHVISYYMLLVIFFEETAWCNITQAGTKGSLGVGFGQLEVSNPEKADFYEWMGLGRDYRPVAGMMRADNNFAVKVHCGYFQWLTDEMGKDIDGCLSAQVGSHTEYKDLFKKGADMLEDAWNANDRDAYITALNHARWKSSKKNGIPVNLFGDFYDFILPETWFTLGY